MSIVKPAALIPLAVIAAGGLACGPGFRFESRDAGLTCDEVVRQGLDAFDDRWSQEPNACGSDLDCVLDSMDVSCPSGALHSFCPVGRAISAAEGFAASVGALDAVVCSPGAPVCSSALCVQVRAACVEDHCVAVPVP